MKKQFDDEYQELNTKLNTLQIRQARLKKSLSDRNGWVVHMRKFAESTEFSMELLNALEENITNQMLMTFIEKVFVYTDGRVEIVYRFRNPFEEPAETSATGIEQSTDCNGEVSLVSEKSKDNTRQRCYNVNGILELQGKNVGSSGGCNHIQMNAAASPERQTKEVWIYDFRTNVHFTLKQHPMTDADLQDFIACYNPQNRYARHETWSEENPDGRWRRFSVKEIMERDKTSLDIFWIKDKSLADFDNLPSPDDLAEDIIENLQSALESFQELQTQLKK